MIITRIRLENWKNFAEVDVHCSKRMFLIGPNASGKSNFLDALKFLRDVAQHGLEHATTIQRGGIKSIRYINARQHPNITISITIDDIWKYSLTIGTEKGKQTPIVIQEIVEKQIEKNGQGFFPDPTRRIKKTLCVLLKRRYNKSMQIKTSENYLISFQRFSTDIFYHS